VHLLTNPIVWHVLAWLLMITFVVGALASRGEQLWPVIPFFALFFTLFIEYRLDPELFWERHGDEWGE
jgi:hypothetical protein